MKVGYDINNELEYYLILLAFKLTIWSRYSNKFRKSLENIFQRTCIDGLCDLKAK
jgi:hypothetical protein